MKKIIILGILGFISLQMNAQEMLYVDDDFMSSYRNVRINTFGNYPDEKISGSPFTTDDFVLGTIIGYEQNFLLRYDAFNDQMLAKRNDDKIVIVNHKNISEVTFKDGTLYKVFNYMLDGADKNGFLEVLLGDSTIMLLKKEIIKFSPPVKPASGYDKATPATFKKARPQYFITNKEGVVNSFDKKKDFMNHFPEKKNDIEKFIKSNKIKFTKEKDLIKLIKHLNTI